MTEQQAADLVTLAQFQLDKLTEVHGALLGCQVLLQAIAFGVCFLGGLYWWRLGVLARNQRHIL